MDDYKVVLNIIKEEYGDEDSSNIYVFLPKPNKNFKRIQKPTKNYKNLPSNTLFF